MYCITHDLNGVSSGFDNCILTSCPPSELSPVWHEFVDEPTPEELAQMDANAEELRNDFTGA
jgi:hypothetical protein